MRFIVIIGSVLLLGTGVMVFRPHVGQLVRDAKDSVSDATSDSHVIGMNEEAIRQANAELKERYTAIFTVQQEIAKQQAQIKSQQDSLAHEESILRRAQDLLTSHPASDHTVKISIGKTEYSRDQLDADVINRVNRCKGIRGNIKNQEASLAVLQKAYNDGLAIINQKKAELQRHANEFEAEKAELAALRAQEHVNEIVSRVNLVGDLKTDLGEARRAFERRVTQLRANAQFDTTVSPATAGVTTWERELGIPEADGGQAIKSYFESRTESSGSAPEKPQGEAPASKNDSNKSL